MSFLEGPRPRILAHRGLAVGVPENTLASFQQAVDAGAGYLESDVRVTADGVAVLVHDATLERVAGASGLPAAASSPAASPLRPRIAELTLDELQAVDLAGHRVPTLREALERWPQARWNLDLKVPGAVLPAARAIAGLGAVERVLVTSFDDRTRRHGALALPGVASSASRAMMVRALAAVRVRSTVALRRALRDVVAVQVPRRMGRLTIVDARSVAAFHAAGVEVHVWTVNDPDEMRELVALGVDGIVTDRADLADQAIGSGR